MGAAMGSDASVYVVDDDDDVRTGLCWLLRSAGWDVLDFASAPAFLEAYDPTRQLPAARREHAGDDRPRTHETLGERGIDIPVVFLTGKGDVGTSVRALKRGAPRLPGEAGGRRGPARRHRRAVERSREAPAAQTSRTQPPNATPSCLRASARSWRHVIRGRLNKQIATTWASR